MRVWPGRPYPLGAAWDGAGVNFAVFSENATAVELCLFDGPHGRERRVPLRETPWLANLELDIAFLAHAGVLAAQQARRLTAVARERAPAEVWIGYDCILETSRPHLITICDHAIVSLRATLIADRALSWIGGATSSGRSIPAAFLSRTSLTGWIGVGSPTAQWSSSPIRPAPTFSRRLRRQCRL